MTPIAANIDEDDYTWLEGMKTATDEGQQRRPILEDEEEDRERERKINIKYHLYITFNY